MIDYFYTKGGGKTALVFFELSRHNINFFRCQVKTARCRKILLLTEFFLWGWWGDAVYGGGVYGGRCIE
jgi:hypothetical protein